VIEYLATGWKREQLLDLMAAALGLLDSQVLSLFK